MTTQAILIIIGIAILAVVFYLGRQLYIRSMRVRQRLQMGKIFTNITHELLTPLTVISASLDQLRDKEPNYNAEYDLMQLNIQRMVRLLQQILETSKSQAGGLKLLVAQGDVMRYIRETALCLEPLMTRNKLSFTIECTPESMMGWIDTDKLDKIIYNLLSNAAKYTRAGGSVKLSIDTSHNFDTVIIKVTDTGSGIPKERIKNLFQRFYDGAYRQHQTTGHGLGLALTRDLVYLHKGKITCESEVDVGTTFTVTIPIAKEAFKTDQIDERHSIDENLPQTAIIDFNTVIPDINDDEEPDETIDEEIYHILIVEDNVELLMLMKQILKSFYRVYVAKNGKEGIDIVRRKPVDLIVSDMMMPEMDGMELTKTIKNDPDYSHLPIILLTAKTQEEDREAAMKAGADEYLMKPFRVGELKLRIDNIVENRKRILQEYSQKAQKAPPQPREKEPSSDEQFLSRAHQCVMNHLSNPDYDRETFAADMGASSSTLYNKLRALTGMSVSNFIRDVRMKESYQIAKKNPDMRVSDLAYQVGFRDPKYFSTCFKNYFGVLPKEFMENPV